VRAIEQFKASVNENSTNSHSESQHRIDIFAQAWLFRVGRTVSEFIGDNTDKAIIDAYIEEKYGETSELTGEPTGTQQADYSDIMSGMQAANEVELYRSVGYFIQPELLQHKHAS